MNDTYSDACTMHFNIENLYFIKMHRLLCIRKYIEVEFILESRKEIHLFLKKEKLFLHFWFFFCATRQIYFYEKQ